MMTFGEKIASLRKANKMTQEDLGKVLNITYQAVSKWERGESLPDFNTMSQIAKIFNVPLSYFEEGGETVQSHGQVQHEQNDCKQPIVISEKVNYAGTCSVCGKLLKEGEQYPASQKIICKSCANNIIQKRKRERAELEKKQAQERERRRYEQLGSGFDGKLIISLVLALTCYIIFIISIFTNKDDSSDLLGFLMLFCPLAVFAIVHAISDLINSLRDCDDGPEGYKRNLSLIVGGAFAAINIILYLIMYFTIGDKNGFYLVMLFSGMVISFTFISQYMWGSVVRDIFTCGGFTFKLPGFIFSLTVDSILWMIVTKIFLGILSILLYILTTIFFAIVAMVGSVVTFIPCVISKTVKDKKA